MASRAELTAIIEEAAARHGVPASALLSIAQIESRMNASAANPTSSAAGLFQFVDATAREYGLTGDRRNDAAAQADAAARMMATNSRSLTRVLGREPDTGELYLAHQQGLGGATALLRNPNKTALEVLTGVYGSEAKARKALTGNGGKASMTASEFAGQWVSKGNSTAARIPPASVGSGNAVATALDTARPAPTPAKPSATMTASRNRQNMTPGADLTDRNAVTPTLKRDGSGVTDPAAIVLGKQMVTGLPQRPGQSGIERTKAAPRAPVAPRNPAVQTIRNANQAAADAERNRTLVATIPSTGVGAAPATRKVQTVPVSGGPSNLTSARSEQAEARGPGAPAKTAVQAAAAIAGPSAAPKTAPRLETPALAFVPGQVRPPTKDEVEAGTGFRLGTGKSALTTTQVEVANPAYARLQERVKQGEMSLSGLSRDAVGQRAKGLAAVEKLKAQLASMKQTTTVTRQTRAPVAAQVRAPAAAAPQVVGRQQTSAVQAFRDQGMTPSQAYDAANQAAQARSEAGATKGHTSSGGMKYDPGSGGWKWTG